MIFSIWEVCDNISNASVNRISSKIRVADVWHNQASTTVFLKALVPHSMLLSLVLMLCSKLHLMMSVTDLFMLLEESFFKSKLENLAWP